MRVIAYLAGCLALLLAGTGLLAFDHARANRAARAAGAPEIGVLAHLNNRLGLTRLLPLRVADDPELAAMLPPAPKGWKQRSFTATERNAYMPAGLPDADADRIAAAFDDGPVGDTRIARRSYEREGQVVVIELSQLPAALFTDPAEAATRQQIETEAADFAKAEALALQGLILREAALSADAPARVLGGDLNAEMQLRVTAPAAISTADLTTLLAGLDVAAMQAAIGLAHGPDDGQVGAGPAATAAEPAPPAVAVNRGTPSRKDKPASLFGADCRKENGRKICGAPAPGG